jgi:hypothetical protein
VVEPLVVRRERARELARLVGDRVSLLVALAAAPAVDGPEAAEFLRALVAWRASGRAVALFEVGAGVGALSRAEPDLSVEGERYWSALAQDGVCPVRLADGPDSRFVEAIGGACGVLVLPDPARASAPPLLRLRTDDERRHADPAALAAAGQVVLD